MTASEQFDRVRADIGEPVGETFANPWELFTERDRRDLQNELRRMVDVSRRAESDSASLRVS